MPLLDDYVIDHILVPAVFVFFLISGIFGVGLGIGLFMFRGRVFRVFGPLNRWISVRKSLKPIEVQRDIDRFVHLYRLWFSALFIVGGTFSIFMLIANVHATAVTLLFGGGRYPVVGPVIIQSLAALLIVGSVLAIAIGIILGFFPRALSALESRTNRWLSSRQIVRGADEMHVPLDRLFESSPRTAGCILAVAALILAINSAIVLFGHH